MSKIRLGAEDIQSINLFEKLTGAKARDIVHEGESICFLVNKEDMGLAIGKKGSNIEKAKTAFGKTIYIIEYAEDLSNLVKNIFYPAVIQEVQLGGDGKTVTITTARKHRRTIIGPGGEKIKLARKVIDRHYGAGDIVIETT
ncbi:MAG: NusA-like transcription termination signal-binding factor [Candidatus Altiarchaeota archaeon]|nr:NusA-like transcription termination signal-binding factor [Candidatus Altiarchaeota archaeon]